MDRKAQYEREAQMYLNGLSLRQISSEVGLSHVSVYHHLTRDLQKYNVILFDKVAAKLEENQPKSIKDPAICQRVLRAYRALVLENKTIDEIASEFKEPFFVIYRDLTTRLNALHKVAPETVTKEMIETSENILSQHSMANLQKNTPSR